MLRSLVGSEMCIRDSANIIQHFAGKINMKFKNVLVTTLRSGSTFLERNVPELTRCVEDKGYKESEQYMPTDFDMFRIHIGLCYKRGFWAFLEDVILNADKVIIHSRNDLRMIAVSHEISTLKNMENRPITEIYSKFDAIQRYYNHIQIYSRAYLWWLKRIENKRGDKMLRTCYEDICGNIEKFIKNISDYIGMPLTCNYDEWKPTDYSQLADIPKILDELETIL